jgi:hypothetical protein
VSWAIGYDSTWKRDIGYGVPAYCDQPGCGKEINRGLGYVCGGEPYGGEYGCGLFFCSEHLYMNASGGRQLCYRCGPEPGAEYEPTPDHPDWINHKLTDESWQRWRDENPEEVARLRAVQPNGAE